MSDVLGRGLLRSLRAHVNHEVAELSRENRTLRNARYGAVRRVLRSSGFLTSPAAMLTAYVLLVLLTLAHEWALAHYRPDIRPDFSGDFVKGYIKDSTSYLMASQVGILAVVTVAVAVVTLLSDREDGASLNGDIRLYYSESFSYELVFLAISARPASF